MAQATVLCGRPVAVALVGCKKTWPVAALLPYTVKLKLSQLDGVLVFLHDPNSQN